MRFIEVMPVGAGKSYVGPSNEALKTELEQWYGAYTLDQEKEGNGPAAYVRYKKLSMPVGFISAIHGKFWWKLQPRTADKPRLFKALSLL